MNHSVDNKIIYPKNGFTGAFGRLMEWTQRHPVATIWMLFFVFSNIFGLILTIVNISYNITSNSSPDILISAILAITGVYATLIVYIPVIWLMYYYPIDLGNIYFRLPLHLFVSFISGVLTFILMMFFRRVILRENWVHYEYGNLMYGFLYEYGKQIIIYWVFFAFIQFIKLYWKWQQDKLVRAHLESKLTVSQLHALQRQLNPHFLFNTMNLISATMRKNVDDADNMLTYLSDLLRFTLNDENADIVNFEKEIKHIGLYLKIMEARFKEKLKIKINIDDDTEKIQVPGFILQPLVENAIRHSINKVETVSIVISSRILDSRLNITVSDNGPGMSKNAEIESSGIGLKNVRGLLESVYGSNFELEFSNKPEGGLTTTIDIPVKIEKFNIEGDSL